MCARRSVRIVVRTVGQSFGCCAVIRDARSGRKLWESRVFPYGFAANAQQRAINEARSRCWTVCGEEA